MGTERSGQTIERMNRQMRIQHGLLLVSVTLLILTGLGLLYSGSWFGQALVSLEGGFEARGWLHRAAAVLLILTALYHIAYIVFSRRGHEEFLQLLLRGRDVRDWMAMLAYDLGRRETKPRLDRYSFREKLQYWAFVVFCLIMILSGALLWAFPAMFGLLPKWTFDVSIAVHSGTGTLIVVVLTLWHLYIVHLAPGRFPGDGSFWHGQMPVERLREEHPLEYDRLVAQGVIRPAPSDASSPPDDREGGETA